MNSWLPVPPLQLAFSGLPGASGLPGFRLLAPSSLTSINPGLPFEFTPKGKKISARGLLAAISGLKVPGDGAGMPNPFVEVPLLLPLAGSRSHGVIGVRFGCFGRKIDGPGLPGGLPISRAIYLPQKDTYAWRVASRARFLSWCRVSAFRGVLFQFTRVSVDSSWGHRFTACAPFAMCPGFWQVECLGEKRSTQAWVASG